MGGSAFGGFSGGSNNNNDADGFGAGGIGMGSSGSGSDMLDIGGEQVDLAEQERMMK